MENVLETYKRPYDPKRPVVCMDEKSKQLVKETRAPVHCRKGHPARFDYEYARNGTANIFVFVEPLRGWRRMEVTARRTKIDWALQIRQLLDAGYPQAEYVTLVMDNLNTLTRKPVRSFCARRGATPDRTHPNCAHAQARKLAECCGG